MRLLVIQEQHFVRMPNGEVWTDEQSDSKFWERYLSAFDEIVVCARFMHSKKYDTTGLMKSDHENVSFVELPNARGVGALLKHLLQVVLIVKKAMNNCDRIIFRAPSPLAMIAYPLAQISKKPYAVELVNNPATTYSPAAMHHFYQPLIQWITVNQTKSLCKNANGVAYVTERILQELYPSRARLKGESGKYFESSYSTIRMEMERYSFTEWSAEMPVPVTLIHTGKMQDNRKGQDIFIHCIYLLRKKGYAINGILVGDGKMRSKFEELGKQLGISEYLQFVGWKAGFEAVQEEIQKAHFGVFPSIGEGLPRSIIECMAQGLLCFGTDVDGIKELLFDNLLVSEVKADSFAEKIIIYLDNWNRVLDDRKKLYNRSLKYEANILNEKRQKFYFKLKNVEKIEN